jgi:hypothetical protein
MSDAPDPRNQNGFREARRVAKAHTGFEPVSGATDIPEPLRRKLDGLRAQSKKKADERR